MSDPTAQLEPKIFIDIQKFLQKTASSNLSEFNLDTPLLNSGALDSLGILELMMFLSDKMEIELEEEDFVPENLETVGSLVRFVIKKHRSAT